MTRTTFFTGLLSVPLLLDLADGYDELVAKVVDALRKSDNASAVSVGREMLNLNRQRYEGHLYLGIALLNQSDFNAAEVSLQAALERAPAQNKDEITTVLTLCRNSKKYATLVSDAQAAEENGLRAKAARLYADAARIFPKETATGLKAAKLLSDLGDTFDAAQIAALVRDNATDTGLRQQAVSFVDSLRPSVAIKINAEFLRGQNLLKSGDAKNAIAIFEAIGPLSNKPADTLVGLIAAHGLLKHTNEVLALLRGWLRSKPDSLSVLGMSETALFYGNDGFQQALSLPSVIELLTDAFGKSRVDSLRSDLVSKRLKFSNDKLGNYPLLRAYVNSLRSISGGTFHMGSPTISSNEKPVHTVTLSAFHLGATPVTFGVWKEYCAATSTTLPTAPNWGLLDDHPVVNVSWNDIMGLDGIGGFCAWASGIAGFRLTLPTEAQFEYGARGGQSGLEYPWGNTFDRSQLWCSGTYNDAERTASVVRTNNIYRNAYGLTDMVGNVYQWCRDWYGQYGSASLTDPTGPSSSPKNWRCRRGGSWDYIDPDNFRCAARYWSDPDSRGNALGFRLSAGPG